MSAHKPQQLVLPMAPARAPALGRADFLVSQSNEHAVAALEAAWPGPRLALIGPAGCGKSHLAGIWANAAGAAQISAASLPAADLAALSAGPVAAHGAERALSGPDAAAAAEALLHLYNLMSEQGTRLLLTGRAAPAHWPAPLADLASRLSTIPVAEIFAPDDALVSSLIIKLCADRQLRLEPAVVARLTRQIERSHAAIARLVDALDRASLLERRTITPKLAAEILSSLEPGRE